MRLEALETRIDEFDERNLVLQLALGLLSASSRLDAILERHVPETPDLEPPALHDEDRLLVDFVLGLVSFRGTIVSLAAEAMAGTSDHAQGHADSPRGRRAADFTGALR